MNDWRARARLSAAGATVFFLMSIFTGSPLSDAVAAAPKPDAMHQLVAGLKVVSYMPAKYPFGDAMWRNWDPVQVDADLAKIKALGATTVRVFPADGGTFKEFLSLASSHGLTVQVTLFGGSTNYADVPGSQTQARQLLYPYINDPRIAFVELKNEIDPNDANAMSWARQMLPIVRRLGHPVTLSVWAWNDPTPIRTLQQNLGTSQPDFYDYHWYGDYRNSNKMLYWAKQFAGSLPLLIGETGQSTATLTEQQQVDFYSSVYTACKNWGLPPAAPWAFSDFTPQSGLGQVQLHYGLHRTDGTAKPAAGTVSAAFHS